eukprot:gene14670-20705_t
MSIPSEFSKEVAACHYCGIIADPQVDYTSELTCSFKACGRRLYHQDCVETHLRRQKMQVGRMAGFGCPRGHHKNATDNDPCGGKISSSHKSHPVNLKKKAKALIPIPKPEFKPPGPKAKNQPAPKPLSKVPHTQRAVANPVANLNAPVPVRPLVRPPFSKVKNTGSDMSQDQMKAAVALIRQQLNVDTTFTSSPAQQPTPVPVVKTPQVPNPLFTTSRVNVPPSLKPDPDFLPALKDPPPPADLSWHEPRSSNPTSFTFNTDAFPSLDNKPQPQPVVAPKPAVHDYTSIEPDSSWCSDEERYNKLIGVASSSDFEIDEGGTGGVDTNSSYDVALYDVASELEYQHSLSPSEQIAPAASSADTQSHELPALTDEMLAYVMQYGFEASGLPAEYTDYVNQMIAQAHIEADQWHQEVEEQAYVDTDEHANVEYDHPEYTEDSHPQYAEDAYPQYAEDAPPEYAEDSHPEYAGDAHQQFAEDAHPEYAVAAVHLNPHGQDAYSDFYAQTQEFSMTTYQDTAQSMYTQQTKVQELQAKAFTYIQPVQFNLPVPLPIPAVVEEEVEEDVNLDDLLALCIG